MRGELSIEDAPYGLGLAMIMWAEVAPESASTAAMLEVDSIMMSVVVGWVSLKDEIDGTRRREWTVGLERWQPRSKSRKHKQKLQALLLRECL